MSPDPAARPRRGVRVAVAALLLVAIVVAATGIASRQSQASRLRERAEAQSVPTVAVVPPGRAGDALPLELPARLEAFARAPIHARVSGYLKRWVADIGTPVKAGQLLAEIETPELDQQLAQAQAELATARASAALAASTARRWQSLLATDSVSRQEADEKAADAAARQSVVNALTANVERFQATKGFARIVAPFDGVVTARATDVGALVSVGGAQGSELFVVSDTRRLRVYVNVPQSYAGAVRRGMPAEVIVPEQPGRRHPATVHSLAQAINSASGAMLVQLLADNAGGTLLPGAFARVVFRLPGNARALTIPPSALIFDRSGLRVATVGPQDRVVMKRVTIARDLGTVVEIADGLAPDDRVIESPPDGVGDGDPVRVAGAAAGAGAGAAPSAPGAPGAAQGRGGAN